MIAHDGSCSSARSAPVTTPDMSVLMPIHNGRRHLEESLQSLHASPPDRVAVAPCVVVVGRLTPDKNLDLVVSAFRKFRLLHPRATRAFVGAAMPGEPAWKCPKCVVLLAVLRYRTHIRIIAGADLVVSAEASSRSRTAMATTLRAEP